MRRASIQHAVGVLLPFPTPSSSLQLLDQTLCQFTKSIERRICFVEFSNIDKNQSKATSANGLSAVDWDHLGRKTSAGLAALTKSNNVGHDVGFLSFPYVHELAIDPNNATAANIVDGFAEYLAGRFNPTVGCTRSWRSSDPRNFVVIIDNIMNLNVLMVSAKLTGNATLRDIATSHTDTTMKNHIWPGGSTWHVY